MQPLVALLLIADLHPRQRKDHLLHQDCAGLFGQTSPERFVVDPARAYNDTHRVLIVTEHLQLFCAGITLKPEFRLLRCSEKGTIIPLGRRG